jgi:hypothetical protein
MVFAAKYWSSSTLSLAAGLYTADLSTTASDTVGTGPINGAYWHYVPSKAVGFSGTADISLNPSDKLTTNCARRLSWEFGWYPGGRAGCGYTNLKDTSWRKMIYICNVTVSAQNHTVCLCSWVILFMSICVCVQGCAQACLGNWCICTCMSVCGLYAALVEGPCANNRR